MKIDFWYKDDRQIAFVDCFFYPNDGLYRGNIYNKDGKAIGDYAESDSTKIEKRFPGIFGK